MVNLWLRRRLCGELVVRGCGENENAQSAQCEASLRLTTPHTDPAGADLDPVHDEGAVDELNLEHLNQAVGHLPSRSVHAVRDLAQVLAESEDSDAAVAARATELSLKRQSAHLSRHCFSKCPRFEKH